jgi:hypothetical protein
VLARIDLLEVFPMRRWLPGLIVLAAWCAASPAGARDYFGFEAGGASAVGQTSDFSTGGAYFDLRWRHHNKGRSAFELEAGYTTMGLGGEITSTIDYYEGLARAKNQAAQQQGGPGEGYVVAEYGTLDIYHLDVNYLFFPLKNARVSPWISFGGGFYKWRVPFRVRFYETPFFGEQHAYLPIAEGGVYSGVVVHEDVDFTKDETTGGLNLGGGATARITSRLYAGATVRLHLIFTSGEGNREELVDNQDYMNDMTILLLKAGLNWRF